MTRTRFLIEVAAADADRVRAMLAGGVRGFHGLAAADGRDPYVVELAAAVLAQIGAADDGRATPAQVAGDVLRESLGYGWWTRGMTAADTDDGDGDGDGPATRVMLHGPHGGKLILTAVGNRIRVHRFDVPARVVGTDFHALTAHPDEVAHVVRELIDGATVDQQS